MNFYEYIWGVRLVKDAPFFRYDGHATPIVEGKR